MHHKQPNRTRYISLALLLLLFFGIVAFRLVQIQIIQAARYDDIAATQRLVEVQLEPERGSLLDSEGRELAFSKDVKTIYATPYLITDPEMAAAELAPILRVSKESLLPKLSGSNGFEYIARKIDPGLAQRVEDADITGIGTIDETTRCYPADNLAAHVIGYVGMDNVGLSGMEFKYNDMLAGKRGELDVEKDPSGTPIPGVGEMKVEPEDGSDIMLTLDREIQFKAETVLSEAVETYGAKCGMLVLMDCRTGEILAMANAPSFDLNEFPETDAAMTRNRCATDAFEPGSVLKVVTAAGALQERLFSPGSILTIPDQIDIADRTFKDFHDMPATMTLTEVIAQSSNVGTIEVAQVLGKEKLYQYMQDFGFGEKAGLDFPGEIGGKLPELSNWSMPSLATIAMGQGVSVTTLQLARMVAAIGNGGMMVQPHLVKATIGPDGYREPELAPSTRVINEEVAAETAAIMREVVLTGTGTRAAMRLYTSAGKTGTGMKPSPRGGYEEVYMASFAGFAPLEDPVLAMAVVLDSPSTQYGGAVAAPVFSEVMEYALRHLDVAPSDPAGGQ
jgi:cell division protein FtsI/penicillin-binding protein 2